MSFSVAIDGPAGAGKSSVAKAVAREMGFIYVDTGAMYRAMAIYFMRKGIEADDVDAIAAVCPEVDIAIEYDNDGVQQVILNGENVSGLIRNDEVGQMASATSVHAPVRKKLVEIQQDLAKTIDVIMDGRDIGTVVLPDADLKIYLTATPECRSIRRYKEYEEKDVPCTLGEVEKEIEERDYRDTHRENSPLRQADDAILIDSTELTLRETIDAIEDLIREKRG